MDFLGQPMPWMAMAAQLEMETSEEVVRSTTVEGHTAMEVFRKPDKEGELNISVAERFWVKIEGEGIDSPQVLQGVAQHLDFEKLEKLAKPTP
jgi:hypothetical protein